MLNLHCDRETWHLLNHNTSATTSSKFAPHPRTITTNTKTVSYVQMFQKTSQNVSKKFKNVSKNVSKNIPKCFKKVNKNVPKNKKKIQNKFQKMFRKCSKHKKSASPYSITPYSTPHPLLYHNIINDHQSSIINHHHQSSSPASQNIKNLHPHTQ